jgi:hypothetical protein
MYVQVYYVLAQSLKSRPHITAANRYLADAKLIEAQGSHDHKPLKSAFRLFRGIIKPGHTYDYIRMHFGRHSIILRSIRFLRLPSPPQT